jgi:hypothetical protein
MQLASLFAAAGLAASSSAFLMPLPESSESDTVTTLPVAIEADVIPQTAQAQNVKLTCPGCPVPVGHQRMSDDGGAKVKTNIPSYLDLDFSIKHEADHDRLVVNGFELYPNSRPIRETLAAKVIPEPQEGRHHMPGHRKGRLPVPQPLGFGLKSAAVGKSKEDNLELIQVDLQVVEVGDIFVDGVPNVEIRLIKSPDGTLLIGGLEVTPSESSIKNPMDKQEDCTTPLCKWRAMLMQQIGRFRGKHCGGGRPAHNAGKLDGVHRHPHPHGNKEHRHRWKHLLRNIASHILLPVAVGIAAGVFASILGMAIGSGIVLLWRTFVRPVSARQHHRRRRGHSLYKADSKETAIVEEKAGLMAHQEDEVDAPPAYVEEGLVEDNTNTDETQH